MDKTAKWTIIILSLQLTICSIIISRLFYRIGFEEGRSSLISDWRGEGDIGTCYQVGGCGELKQTKRGHK